MNQYNPKELNTYSILIQESLDAQLTNWFRDVTMLPLDDGMTLLVGTFADHPPVRDFLRQTWGLELTVVSIYQVKDENQMDSEFTPTMDYDLIKI